MFYQVYGVAQDTSYISLPIISLGLGSHVISSILSLKEQVKYDNFTSDSFINIII